MSLGVFPVCFRRSIRHYAVLLVVEVQHFPMSTGALPTAHNHIAQLAQYCECHWGGHSAIRCMLTYGVVYCIALVQ